MSKSSDDKQSQSIPITSRKRPATSAPADLAEDTASSATTDTPTQRPPAQNSWQQGAQQDSTAEYGTPGRKAADQRPGAFNPLAWLLEGATGFVEEARHSDLGLSEEFWQHFYATRRESLLTARALIDSLLAQTERDATQRAERETRKQRRGTVPIQADPTKTQK
ncbi:MAG: hypothetical protein WDZ49_01585 [Litorilinea sp.]